MIADLRALWATRRSSGFPWPFRWGMSPPPGLGRRQWITGHVWYTAVPLRRQLLGIPLRPWRYAKMVRTVAMARNREYAPTLYDDVA